MHIYQKLHLNGFDHEVVEAMHLCMLGHHGQRRRSKVMYALHPMRILVLAEAVFELPSYVKSAILLHDVFEDSTITPEQARTAGISERAVEIALELTRPPVKIENNVERRKVRLEQLLAKARIMSNEARFVKALDRMDNLADGFVSFSRPKLWHYTKESIQLYHALSEGVIEDSFKSEAVIAVNYLRQTINVIIESVKDGGDARFDNFDIRHYWRKYT